MNKKGTNCQEPAMSATTAAATTLRQQPLHQVAASPSGKRRGNPNLALAPRCGASTRTGCPCRAPAIHGKLRCRMHGGRSTGPRTPDGIARVRTARTIHGRYGAETRAWRRHVLTMLRRGTVFHDAFRYAAHLPPDMVVRLHGSPPELALPRFSAGCLSRAEDRAVMWAEAEALAPWKQAIALAKEAGRRNAAPPAGSDRTDPLTGAEGHAPEQPPAARSDPAAIGDAGAREEALATEQQMVATVASTVPVASRDGQAKAKPLATEQATDTRQWDGIRLRPPSQAISLRQQLLAATDHDNLTAWAARVAGWGMIAEAVTTFGAAPLI
jgi:hypothetical protein